MLMVYGLKYEILTKRSRNGSGLTTCLLPSLSRSERYVGRNIKVSCMWKDLSSKIRRDKVKNVWALNIGNVI